MKHFKSLNIYTVFLLLSLMIFTIQACKKEEKVIDRILPEVPFNPYDTIDYGNINIDPIIPDSNTFAFLQQKVFSVKCANPACHDGTFEPDFRTISSSYNTLVYHPVFKNTPDEFYTYRVVPGDTTNSWLWDRVTTDDPVLGKMPLYDTLENWQLTSIKNWILQDAKDVFGNSPDFTGYKPGFFGNLAYIPALNNMRVDTIRYQDIFFYPFIVPQNVDLQIWIGLYEQNVAGDFLPGSGLGHNKVKYSVNSPNNFSNAMELNLNKQFTPFFAPSLFGADLPYFHYFTLNTGQFQVGDIVYIRSYVSKQGGSTIYEVPGQDDQPYLFSYFSFIVQ
ncbi:MAG: hypothetical protein EA412_14030 [Chitinophagaceae bacterium]|nr:MAG: hypothetical protein EA412_14030 [Chitinophagaceae bacterium]